jgi:hypothetical protein
MFEASESLQVNVAITHCEVSPFSEFVAQVVGEVGVLERTLVVHAWAQHHDARVVSWSGIERCDAAFYSVKIAPQTSYAIVVKKPPKCGAQGETVFKGIPRARRRRRTVRIDEEVSVGVTTQVKGGQVQIEAAHRMLSDGIPGKIGVSKNEFKGEHPLLEQALFTVDIREEGIEEP